MLRIPGISREYLHVPVSGGSLSTPVEIALVASGTTPATGDWTDADAWDGTIAKLLIGPGGTVELAAGTYRVWVRVTATPEIPVIESGLVRIG